MAGLIKRNFVSKNARLPDTATAISAISADIPKLENLSYRDQLTLAKRIAFAGVAIAANEEPVDLPAVETAIRAIYAGMKYKAAGSAGPRALAALIAHRRQLLGLSEPALLASSNKSVLTETALLCVTTEPKAWPLAAEDDINASTTTLLETGADGRYSVELRLVDGPEPSLSDAEMRKTYFMSRASDIEVTGTGCWLGAWDDPKRGAFLALPAGRYVFQIYTMGFVSGIKVVLSHANGMVNSPFDEPVNLQH